MSLRARILGLTVGVAAAVLLLFAVPFLLLLNQAAGEQARDSATDVAQGVADYISTGAVDASALGDYVDRINDRDDGYPVEVVLSDGTRVGASVPGLDEADPDGDGRIGGRGTDDGDGDADNRYGDLRPTSQAQTRSVDGGSLVVIQVSTTGGPVTVAAFASDAQVRRAVEEKALVLVGAGLLLLLLAAGAAELVARRLVRHLTAAAETADLLGEGDLNARVPDDGPEEVRRVGAALNRLAGRIDELLAAERETVADLSHRLRTPLTAVRLDVESLPDSDGKAELEEHLAQLERTLTAVIHAARRPQREGAAPHCDASAVTRDRFDFWAPLAEDQGRDVTLSVPSDAVSVRCAGADLAAALDALLENAVAHTAEGVAIAVVLAPGDDGAVTLDVRDRGPGVPPTAVHRGRSDRGSTGLGLDIARSCAEASGGRLELVTVDDWSVVRLVLGRP
ncbi:HAMP domain-containing sensor histidine kinase [Nocardioides sp. CN2-186]|uniref:sensor histidine kinase n=1 Tax=Nocardioides tweenelious TaxID=3156607 RepID=UPI0032B42E62